MTQTKSILEHLKSGRTITMIEALNFYHCGRLAPRIHELRRQGHNIVTEGKDQWAVYRLVSGVSSAVSPDSFTRQGVLLDAPTLPRFEIY